MSYYHPAALILIRIWILNVIGRWDISGVIAGRDGEVQVIGTTASRAGDRREVSRPYYPRKAYRQSGPRSAQGDGESFLNGLFILLRAMGVCFRIFSKAEEDYITRSLLADNTDVMRGFGERVRIHSCGSSG